MRFFKLKKIITTVKIRLKKYPWQETACSLKFLPAAFCRWEKIILLLCFGAVVALTVVIGYRDWLASTNVVPETGGVYKEGIVGESKDLDKHLARLVNAGLTKYDLEKNIVPDMAQKWEINEDGKVYVFHLNPQFNAEDLARQIINKGVWQDIDISTPDPSTITFTFKQPFSPFLYNSTAPIFEAGPYRLTKENKNEIELLARDDYYAGRPWIDKIIIKLYQDQNELLKAARRGEIDGFSSTTEMEILRSFRKMEMKLPRELIVFFNLSRPGLQNINIRQALKENSNPGKALELKLATSNDEKNISFARKIVEKWGQNGVKVNLIIKDNVTLQKDIIPKRDYDVLLYGLDYGEDPDPYPFWHSSQINPPTGGDGKNLSNFKNTKGDKLLEEARQEFDFKKREEKYAEFQKILDVEIPAFVVDRETFYYQISNQIYGIEKIVGALETDHFLNIASWYLNTKRVKK